MAGILDPRTNDLLHCCADRSGLSYRDWETVLHPVVAALSSGWLPDGLADLGGPALRRAAYLIDLYVPAGPDKDAWLTAARERLDRDGNPEPIPFFYNDPFPRECGDDVAAEWGLARGMDMGRYRQWLATRAMCARDSQQ